MIEELFRYWNEYRQNAKPEDLNFPKFMRWLVANYQSAEPREE